MKTFKKGGIHPEGNKMAAEFAIEKLDIPNRVFIPVNQHIGAPATILVKKGDTVKVGQMIAKGESFISANIHSSVSGKVFKVDDVTDTSGYRSKSIIIDVENDIWEDSIDQSENIIRECNLSSKEIVDKIHEMGIVGLGGATFPSHVKYMVPEGQKVNYLIINGVECEPYLTSDHRVMLERPIEMLVGISIMMKALGVEKALVGIENNKKDAIEILQNHAKEFKGIEIHPLKIKYPQGAEKQLIKALIGREIPSGKLPLSVGCVVNNSGTAVAVYDAIQKNKPLFERIVTLTGKGLKDDKFRNYIVRFGTPVSALLDAIGGAPEDTAKIISGGPMMGKSINNTSVPITKGSSGILLMTEKEASRKKIYNCIRCARCVNACPMGLEPILIAQFSLQQNWEECEKARVLDCIECGSCSYTCPAGRPLLDYIRNAKAEVNKIIRTRNQK